MPLIKDGALVDDPWVFAGWLAEAPDDAPVVVPLALTLWIN